MRFQAEVASSGAKKSSIQGPGSGRSCAWSWMEKIGCNCDALKVAGMFFLHASLHLRVRIGLWNSNPHMGAVLLLIKST
jgi:hypothetical protein